MKQNKYTNFLYNNIKKRYYSSIGNYEICSEIVKVHFLSQYYIGEMKSQQIVRKSVAMLNYSQLILSMDAAKESSPKSKSIVM